MSPYTFFDHIDQQLGEIPADSIISRTLHNSPELKVILFGFAPGQELSEHTAARPALLHFLRGDARLTLGKESYVATAGTFVQMQPHLPHSVYAQTEVVMLLLMLASGS
jgi:quercetin dioxygenase-like cupin family protein